MINVYNFYTFSRFDISNINNQQPIDFTTQKNKKTAWNQRKHTGNHVWREARWEAAGSQMEGANEQISLPFSYGWGCFFGDTSRLIKMEGLEV